jgi:tRNA wybutosine-synthesizing protein 1
MDDPETIVAEAVDKHVAMIRQLRGLPGLRPERWEEAHTVRPRPAASVFGPCRGSNWHGHILPLWLPPALCRVTAQTLHSASRSHPLQVRHCALSLVGEPIMYPRINELIRGLHARRISSFLVTNAQFPEAIAALGPVTQLYVSIDAGTKEALRELDRPLFADFWERYLACLDALRSKGQRTVYRLTLVKDATAADGSGAPGAVDGKAANRPAGGARGNMGDVSARS